MQQWKKRRRYLIQNKMQEFLNYKMLPAGACIFLLALRSVYSN